MYVIFVYFFSVPAGRRCLIEYSHWTEIAVNVESTRRPNNNARKRSTSSTENAGIGGGTNSVVPLIHGSRLIGRYFSSREKLRQKYNTRYEKPVSKNVRTHTVRAE